MFFIRDKGLNYKHINMKTLNHENMKSCFLLEIIDMRT
jgi:hypothetical protein